MPLLLKACWSLKELEKRPVTCRFHHAEHVHQPLLLELQPAIVLADPAGGSGIAVAWQGSCFLRVFFHLACSVSVYPVQGLGWVLVGILATTLGWYLKNIFGRKKTILALLRSTRSARKNLARLRTLMRSGKDAQRQRSLSSSQ